MRHRPDTDLHLIVPSSSFLRCPRGYPLESSNVTAPDQTPLSHPAGKRRVGIGLPVFNGEKFLEESIRSIVEQTFEDFELVIGDNASTDATEEICRSFERDPRVTYVRRERNLGATPNYNDLMSRLEAPLVRWQACDDAIAPEYLGACVAMLDEDQGASMAHAHARVIDGTGGDIGGWDQESALEADAPVDRWEAMAVAPDWHSIFGLVRREVLDAVGLFPIYPGSDRWVLGGWLLHGHVRLVEEPLFIWRDHAETFRRTANQSKSDAENWWSTDLKSWPLRTTVLGCRHGRRVIGTSPLNRKERKACRRLLHRQVASPAVRKARGLIRI